MVFSVPCIFAAFCRRNAFAFFFAAFRSLMLLMGLYLSLSLMMFILLQMDDSMIVLVGCIKVGILVVVFILSGFISVMSVVCMEAVSYTHLTLPTT